MQIRNHKQQKNFQFYNEIPRKQSKDFQKSDPFRGDGDINYKKPQQQNKQHNQSDLFSGNNFYQGRRGLVPGYQEYADRLKIEDQKVRVHTKRIEPNYQEERRPTRKYIPEPRYEGQIRQSGRKRVTPIQHVEPNQFAHPHPHYVPSDIYRSTEGIPKVTQAMKDWKPSNYVQIGQNEKIWQPRARHELWESHKDIIVGVQYPMHLTDQPISIDNRKCSVDQKQALEQLKQNQQLAKQYKDRILFDNQ